MSYQIWNDIINNDNFIINNKKMRIFPVLKKNKDYEKLLIDDESFNFITFREISSIITKIICHHLISHNLNPLNINVVDATAGVGGNSLSFLSNLKNVISIEICKMRYEYLVNNINVYEYDNSICVNDDFCNYYKQYNVLDNIDVIFIDPPWGGIGYKNLTNLQLNLGDESIEDIVLNIYEIYKNNGKLNRTKFVILKLPKNYDIKFFYEKISSKNNKNYLNNNINIYLYFLNKMFLLVCELIN